MAPVARSPFFWYEAVYTFFADGRIDVDLDGKFDQSRTFLPRLGFSFKVEERRSHISAMAPAKRFACCAFEPLNG